MPSPSYLYPSSCHREALGHLRYALESGEGFVEITGEVGTGKTTLLRTFLDGLDETVAVACVFNPTLNAVELLQSINRDFGADASSTSRSELTAALQNFLIANRKAGKRALLVIDEAQNLSIEVLEGLRLLSNLETTRSKLLQIVLCGQPELGVMLERYELRQLAQRISLACRLRPFSLEETHLYIMHRVAKAALGDGSELFTKGARALIHRFAAGTPRVINICCDRALLCAYVAGKKKVDKGAVKEALTELSDRPYLARKPGTRTMLTLGGGALFFSMVLGTLFFFMGQGPVVKKPVGSVTVSVAPVAPPMVPATYQFSDLFDEASVNGSVVWGVRQILSDWGHELKASELPPISDPYLLLSAAAAPRSMEVLPLDAGLDALLSFQLPALVLFSSGGELPLALVYDGERHGQLMQFYSEKGCVEISLADVNRLWTGRAIIACANPLGFSTMVTAQSGRREVIALESALSRAGFDGVTVDGRFDSTTRMAVHALQAAYGIPTDGKVGTLTRVALASALKNGLPVPVKVGGGHVPTGGTI